MTALFGRRKVLASTETKPGRSPKNVDYVGAWGYRRQLPV